MVMTMISALVQRRNYGENGDGDKHALAYPRIAIRSIRLSPTVRNRDEKRPNGGDSALWTQSGFYPDSILAFPGIYP